MQRLTAFPALLVLIYAAACAGETAVNFSLASYHLDEPNCSANTSRPARNARCRYALENGFNERNPGLIFEKNSDQSHTKTYFIAGVFRDSFNDGVGLVGMGWRFSHYRYGHLCAEAGSTISDTPTALLALCGVVGPIKLGYFPDTGDGGSDAFWLTVRWLWN